MGGGGVGRWFAWGELLLDLKRIGFKNQRTAHVYRVQTSTVAFFVASWVPLVLWINCTSTL